jgi:hypothetical protein
LTLPKRLFGKTLLRAQDFLEGVILFPVIWDNVTKWLMTTDELKTQDLIPGEGLILFWDTFSNNPSQLLFSQHRFQQSNLKGLETL